MLWEVLRQGFNVSIFIYIYNTQNLCVCVRVTALLLSPRHNTNLRPMLLDPVLPKECPSEKNFTKKMTSGGITDKKLRHQCFVNGENLELFVLSLETRNI